LKDFEYFGKMFRFEEEIESPETNLTKIKKELEGVSVLWQKIVNCQEVFDGYKKLGFLEFDCMEKEDEVKSLRKGLNDLKGIDKKSGVFLGIMEDIKKWMFFLPLCAEMRDPSMETADGRHWDKVKKLVKKDFNIDTSLLIDEVWNLELYKYKDDVEDITDQSKQELKMERGIAKIVEKWQEVEFESIRHKDTNIYTLKMIDENFE
jgi:dynein heavy chain